MAAIKKFIVSRGLGYWISVLPLALGFAALALYHENGINEFCTELKSSVMVGLWFAAAVCVIAFFFDSKTLRYISYLLYLFSFLGFIGSQVNYIANVMVSIDGTSFSSGFVATAVCFVLAIVFMLAAAITPRIAPWNKGRECVTGGESHE